MIKIESLKDYISELNKDDFFSLAFNIYETIEFLSSDYPKHKEWYFKKQLPAINTGERNILFVRNPHDYNEIIAMACLKKTEDEKKICTIYVKDEYRGLGIGTKIIDASLNWLGTTKPLITISEYKLDMFNWLIEKYNWQVTDKVKGLYNDKYKEYCFNGTILKKKELEEKLVRILNRRIKDLKRQ